MWNSLVGFNSDSTFCIFMLNVSSCVFPPTGLPPSSSPTSVWFLPKFLRSLVWYFKIPELRARPPSYSDYEPDLHELVSMGLVDNELVSGIHNRPLLSRCRVNSHRNTIEGQILVLSREMVDPSLHLPMSNSPEDRNITSVMERAPGLRPP